MQQFIDDNYMVFNNVLLKYSGKEKDLVIPNCIGGIPIHTIGRGAFVFSDVENVTVSDGIRKISDSAFSECREMKNLLMFPSVKEVSDRAFDFSYKLRRICQVLCYTEEEYLELKRTCACDGGTRYMAYEIPDIGDNAYLSPGAFGIEKQHRLPRGIRRLFCFQNDSHGFPVSFDHEYKKTLPVENIFHSVTTDAINDEMEAIPALIREGFPKPDYATETENTRITEERRKFGEHVNAGRTVVLFFDDRNTRHIGGIHYVIGEYSIGYHFWQSLVPLTKNGEKFYMYRRCFLGSNSNYAPDLAYVRYNICYCDESGRKRWK